MARGVGVVLVLLEPLDERDGSLGGQLVAGCVVRELRERTGKRVDRQGGVGTKGKMGGKGGD